MRADSGVRHDSTGCQGSRLLGELGRIEPDQRDLVEQGSIADHLRHGIHREGELLGTARRQVRWYDHLSGAFAVSEDEAIALSRASLFVVLRCGGDPAERQTKPEAERTRQHGPSLLTHPAWPRPWKDSPTPLS